MKYIYLFAALAVIAAPASAQEAPADAIIVTTQDIPAQYEVLGDVHVEIMPAGVMPSTPVRQSLNEALRAEAAKRGANAVIKVVYGKRTFLDRTPVGADGKAVRIAMAPPIASPVPSAPGADATIQSPPPSLGASVAGAQPSPSAPVTGTPAIVSAPSVQHARSADMVIISQDDVPYRRYTVLGEVTGTGLRRAVFSKVEPEEQMDQQMRAKAFAMGADAVILVKYHMGAAFPSTPSTSTGKAVRFD